MLGQRVIYTSKKAAICIRSEKPLKKGCLGRLHYHHEAEILFVTKGGIVLHNDKDFWTVKAGEAVVVCPRCAHYGEVTEDGTMFMMAQCAPLDTADETMQILARFVAANECTVHLFKIGSAGASLIKEQLSALCEATEKPASCRDYHLLAHKYKLLAFLYESEILAPADAILLQMNVEAILPILSYIHENYVKDFSLSDLACALSFNKNYLCRLFKKITGKTIVDYLNFYRIHTAEKLLREGKRATEAALLTGFSSQAYFSRVFKKHLFLSPAEYRRQALTGST